MDSAYDSVRMIARKGVAFMQLYCYGSVSGPQKRPHGGQGFFGRFRHQ